LRPAERYKAVHAIDPAIEGSDEDVFRFRILAYVFENFVADVMAE